MVLHQKLRSTSYTLQEVRLIILGAYNARQTNAVLPTAETSSSQTTEAIVARQPAESASRAFSSGHNTTVESMAGTRNLRHRAALPNEVSGSPLAKRARRAKGNNTTPFSKFPPQVQDMMNKLATRIIESGLPQRHELEPRLGTALAIELMSFRPGVHWLSYGEKGESILTLMVDMSEGGGFACMWCEHRPAMSKWKRTVAHIREHHLGFRPFPCDKVHDAAWWAPIPLTSDFR